MARSLTLLVVGLAAIFSAASNDAVAASSTLQRLPDVRVKAGERFPVAFTITGGTGFKWWPEQPLPQHVTYVGTDYQATGADSGPGAKTQQILSFLAVRPGEGEIVFVFKRGWEKTTSKDPKAILKVIGIE